MSCGKKHPSRRVIMCTSVTLLIPSWRENRSCATKSITQKVSFHSCRINSASQQRKWKNGENQRSKFLLAWSSVPDWAFWRQSGQIKCLRWKLQNVGFSQKWSLQSICHLHQGPWEVRRQSYWPQIRPYFCPYLPFSRAYNNVPQASLLLSLGSSRSHRNLLPQLLRYALHTVYLGNLGNRINLWFGLGLCPHKGTHINYEGLLESRKRDNA